MIKLHPLDRSPEPFSLLKRLKSFQFAFAGIRRFFVSEHNAWLHVLATIGVILLCILFPVSHLELVMLVFCVGFVWSAEIFNTCIEKIMDHISTEKHPAIKTIKDMSAAAVLVSAVTALAAGLIIFIPKIFSI